MIAFWKRNKDMSLLIPFFIIIYWKFPLNMISMTSTKLESLREMMDSVLSFSALATAFLFFAVTFIPIIANNTTLFTKFKTDQKFLERIMFVSFIFLFISFLCLLFIFGYIYDVNFGKIFFSIFISVLLYGIWGMFGLFFELIRDSIKKINTDD